MEDRKNFFPHQLMFLASSDHVDCIVWSIDGKAFTFIDRVAFIQKLTALTKTKPIKCRSLTRKLNRWGFKLNTCHEPNPGMYSHPLFQRDKPWLCSSIAYENSSQCTVEVQSSEKPDKKRKPSHDEDIIDHECKRLLDLSALHIRNTRDQYELKSEEMIRNNIRDIDRKIVITEMLIEDLAQCMLLKKMRYNWMKDIEANMMLQSHVCFHE